MILTVTAPNGHSVDVDTEENPHTCIIDDSFTCIACVAQSLYVTRTDKAPSELLTDDHDGYADMSRRALTAGLTDAERAAAGALAERVTRTVVSVGWDGRSNPILRYQDELHLPDHMRSVVSEDEEEDE